MEQCNTGEWVKYDDYIKEVNDTDCYKFIMVISLAGNIEFIISDIINRLLL